MNKDQVDGNVEDITDRIERQAGERTGEAKTEVRGAFRQSEGELQTTWGNVKAFGRRATDKQINKNRRAFDC
jgi:uncharacterized protein YjbJ (UPF0337 family)